MTKRRERSASDDDKILCKVDLNVIPRSSTQVKRLTILICFIFFYFVALILHCEIFD